jgi:predicted ribosomally synthesized peptide with SipW-like signal peptide
MAIGRSAVLLSALAVGALLTTGSTYAAFSDYGEIAGNHMAAGTVVVGGEGGAAPDLNYSGVQPAQSTIDTMKLRYAGTIAADLWFELEAGTAADAFCLDSGGAWAAKPGGSLQIQVDGGAWLDYCTALNGQRLPIASDVQPSTSFDVHVAVRLVDGTDARYSGLTGVDGLVVRALQTGGAGFSDFARGTITVGAGGIAPLVPQQCVAAGLTDFDETNTIYLTDETPNPFNVGKPPEHGRGYLVFGTAGDDVITGSNQADCIVGGAGDDHLVGGNQDDVLLGDDGNDVLNGPTGAEGLQATGDDKPGGNGKDRLYGGAGDDELHGANGRDLLDGGDDIKGDLCVDEPNGNGQGHGQDKGDEAGGNPGGNGKDTFVGCEFDGTPPTGLAAKATIAGPPADTELAPSSTNDVSQVDGTTPASGDEGRETTDDETSTGSDTPTTSPTTAPPSEGDQSGPVDGQPTASTNPPSTEPTTSSEPTVVVFPG